MKNHTTDSIISFESKRIEHFLIILLDAKQHLLNVIYRKMGRVKKIKFRILI